MNISNGKHKILFSQGKLYLDGVQIAGEGIYPPKDVVFEFHTEKKEDPIPVQEDPSILSVNVHDSINATALGPGQC